MGDAAGLEIENLSLNDDLLTCHKKERKELQAKIQALKKSAGKGDKKKKKEILDEIVRLETDLERKHTEELSKFTINQSISKAPEEEAPLDSGERVSKAQKRRDKKLKEEKEKQAEILAQEEINKTGPRNLEIKAIKKLLNSRKLHLHPIQSDGNCLYNAIKHQLTITERSSCDTQQLRNITADYIAANKDTLIFYMTNPVTGDCLTDIEFENYCQAIRNTPAWGGQIEIKALSHMLKVPIEILQATGPPTVQGESEFNGPNLVITYHRFMYSLGEHYNSTRILGDPKSSEDESGSS